MGEKVCLVFRPVLLFSGWIFLVFVHVCMKNFQRNGALLSIAWLGNRMYKLSISVVTAYNKRYVESLGEIEKSFFKNTLRQILTQFWKKKRGANENKSLLLSLDEPANSNLGHL